MAGPWAWGQDPAREVFPHQGTCSSASTDGERSFREQPASAPHTHSPCALPGTLAPSQGTRPSQALCAWNLEPGRGRPPPHPSQGLPRGRRPPCVASALSSALQRAPALRPRPRPEASYQQGVGHKPRVLPDPGTGHSRGILRTEEGPSEQSLRVGCVRLPCGGRAGSHVEAHQPSRVSRLQWAPASL